MQRALHAAVCAALLAAAGVCASPAMAQERAGSFARVFEPGRIIQSVDSRKPAAAPVQRAEAPQAKAAAEKLTEAPAVSSTGFMPAHERKAKRAAGLLPDRNAQQESRSAAGEAAESERKRAEAEAAAKKDAEIAARKEAEAQAARKQAEEAARKEQEAQALATLEAQARARKEAEEKVAAKKQAEAQAKKEADAQIAARKKAEAQATAKKEAEAQAAAKKQAEAQAKKEADAQTAARKKAEAQAAARKEAEAQALAKREAESKARKEAEAQAAARRQAEAQAAAKEAEAQAKAKKDAEAQAKAKRDVEEKTKLAKVETKPSAAPGGPVPAIPVVAVDEAKVKELMDRIGCPQCHAWVQKKTGPPMKTIIKTYAGKAPGDVVAKMKTVKEHKEEKVLDQLTDNDFVLVGNWYTKPR